MAKIQKIKPIKKYLGKIYKLNPVVYNYTKDPKYAVDHIGLIPKDVKKVLSEILTADKENGGMKINTDVLCILLLAEIQEIKKQLPNKKKKLFGFLKR